MSDSRDDWADRGPPKRHHFWAGEEDPESPHESFEEFFEEFPVQAVVTHFVTLLADREGADGFALVLWEDGEYQQYLDGARTDLSHETSMKVRVAIAEALGVPPERLL